MLWWTLRQLRSKRPNIRMSAVKQLGESREPRAIEPLIAVLKDSDIGVRYWAARTLVCSLAIYLLLGLSGCGSASTCSIKTPRQRIRETERPDLRGVQTIRVVIKSSSSNPNIAQLPFVEVASRLLTWAEITPAGPDDQSADGVLEISPDGRPIGTFYGAGPPGILVHTSAEVKGTLKLSLRGQSEIASRYFDGYSKVPGITSASRSDEDASIDVYTGAMYAPDGFVTAMFDLLEQFGFHFLWRVSDPDPYSGLRHDYSDAIGKIRQPIAEEALINILKNDPVNNIAAAGALAQIKSPCAAEALIKAAKRPWLRNSDRWPRWPLREFVVKALGGLSGPKVEEALAAVEKDEGEDEDIRKIAAESLKRIRAERQK